jgi:hypothetical protein
MNLLTLNEKKNIVKKVLEGYQGITISEARTNQNIKKEIKLNLVFYNEIKKGFLNETKSNIIEVEGLGSGILQALGTVKDILSTFKVVKDITTWIKNFISKIVNKFKDIIIKHVPGGEKGLKNLQKFADGAHNFLKWLYNTFTYKGLAKLFAMIRYRTFFPTKEQKECMTLAAQKVYKVILIILIVAFIIKVILVIGPLIGSATTAVQAGTPLVVALIPFKAVLAKIGILKVWSLISTGIKIKDVQKLNDEIKAEEKTAKEGELNNFSEAWNKCKKPEYKNPTGDYYTTESLKKDLI